MAVTASSVGSASKTVGPGTANRICLEPECLTRLSRYNDGDHCSLHAPMVTPRTRGVKSGDL